MTVSFGGKHALSHSLGVVTLYEFRLGQFIQSRLQLLNRNANTWNMVFPARPGSFYQVQSSWDLTVWETFENTIPGTAGEIITFFKSITEFTNVFGGVLEFLSPQSKN